MIVQVQTRHLPLPDERFSFVMDQLEEPLQALKQLGQQPLQVTVTLEKTVQHAPQKRRGERQYRADVTVDTSRGTARAAGQADAVQQAIVCMTHRLMERTRTWRTNQMGERPAGAGTRLLPEMGRTPQEDA